ncbi:MAG: adenine phosphoribosyltransferase [Actinomycetota bacterium]|nr:adenine phosphoribosyltransferase [Actinomycetota bacterium]
MPKILGALGTPRILGTLRTHKIRGVGFRSNADDLAALLAPLIREVPDFPRPGVLFQDLAPVFADATAFRAVVDALIAPAQQVDVVVGVEARGFLLGAAAAYALGAGVVGVRKPGKLPVVSDREGYALEYGVASLELAHGVLRPGQRALVVDDVLATGGTAAAACVLVERAGATVSGIAVLLEIASLHGRDRLVGRLLHALLTV